MIRTLAILLLAFAATVTTTAAPASARSASLRIGVADQKPETFSDPRFKQLGIRDSRLLVPWDLMEHPSEVARADAWLQSAYRNRVHPLITFTRSSQKRRVRMLPSVNRYYRDFRRFHRRWPWVRDFSVWNEPNLCKREPTCRSVRRVVGYYRKMRHYCPRCRIAAGEVIDLPGMVSWIRRFQHILGFAPKYWGVHNYRDTNREQTLTTRELLDATSSRTQIWITETGGLVRHGKTKSHYFDMSTRHAASATHFLFSHIIPLSSRITRVYLYNWSVQKKHDWWDSALINSHGKPRPAYRVFARQLHRLRRYGREALKPRRSHTARHARHRHRHRRR